MSTTTLLSLALLVAGAHALSIPHWTTRHSRQTETSADEDCICMPYYQCDNRFGEGILQERATNCPGELDTCCKTPLPNTTQPIPAVRPDDKKSLPNTTQPITTVQPDDQTSTSSPSSPDVTPTSSSVTPTTVNDTQQTEETTLTTLMTEVTEQSEEPSTSTEGISVTPVPTSKEQPNIESCGQRNPQGYGSFEAKTGEVKPSLRITAPDGFPDTAEFAEFPWMAAILLGNNDNVNLTCGASLVNPSVLVTAAHCLLSSSKTIDQSLLKVRVGEWDSNSETEALPHQDRTISRVILHPEYNSRTLFNDIALIRVHPPFDLSENVQPICLPQALAPPDITNSCLSTGWGKNQHGRDGEYQSVLKKLELPLLSNDICQKQLKKTRLGPYFELDKSFICAASVDGKDTCQGDGGGPLMCPLSTDPSRYVLVGVVSWGIDCGKNPGVYAGVFRNAGWLADQIASLSTSG